MASQLILAPPPGLSERCLGHRAPLLWLALPFMAGLSAGGSGWAAPVPEMLVLACLTALTAIVSARRLPRVWAPVLVIAMLGAGNASYSLHRHLLLTPWHGGKARLALRVERVFPQTRPYHAHGLATIVGTDPPDLVLTGQRIYFSLALGKSQSPLIRSSVILGKGVLNPVPDLPPTDSFEGYLAGLGVNFKFSRARLLSVCDPAGTYCLFCERLATHMDSILTSGLENQTELSAVYRAMMLGRKGNLSPGQKELFLRSGTMHLFAINGLHIGVVALTVHAFLALLRCPRRAASVLVLAILWIDVDTTGASPSAVRAFILIAMLEVAAGSRRPGNPLAALATAAMIVLLGMPLDFFSASFRMSYGVVAAIFTLGLPLAEWLSVRFAAYPHIPAARRTRFQRLRAAFQRHVFSGLGVGLSAALVSAVTGIEFFGVLTPAGLVANLLIAPPAMLVLVAGFSSLVAGLSGWFAAARFFNGSAAVILRVIDRLVRLIASVPGGCLTAHFRAGWIGPVALAALMAACFATYCAGAWRTPRSWWPAFGVVALVLAAGVAYS